MKKKALKVPKKKGYADGGPVTEFSWDDYYKRLEAWKDANAQEVPRDIVDYESKWIVPQIKQAQTTLNAALATKYGLQPGQAPAPNQFLTAEEAKAAIGDDNYATYLTNVQGYQAYRDKVAGSYKAPKSTAGAFDPSGEKYGQRHFGLFTLSPEQAAANVATTQAAGKPTSQAEANAQSAQPATVTNTQAPAVDNSQDTIPSSGIMVPPGKTFGTSAPATAAQTGTDSAPAPVVPKYTKHVTNYGQTLYYTEKDGKKSQVSQQEYDSGVKQEGAELYLLDESTGLYDDQGNPKTATPVKKEEPAPAPPVAAPPKLKKGGRVGGKKKNGYADGGPVVAPDSLTGDQLIAFEKLTTDAERQAYLDSVAAGTDGDIAELTNKQKAIASLAPVAGQLGAAGVNLIDVDPLNKNANIAQGAGAGALKGAGTGLALGMSPLLLAATSGLSAPIGAAAGAIAGGVAGGIKGKKKYGAARDAADESARANAMALSYQDSGYADGGKITGPGTTKSDDIPAKVQRGSFIVPVENAKLAEMLRKQYLPKEAGKAKLKQTGNAAEVKLSNGEHMFSPEEYDILVAAGVDVDGLAPNAEKNKTSFAGGGPVGGDPVAELIKQIEADKKAAAEKRKKQEEERKKKKVEEKDKQKVAQAQQTGSEAKKEEEQAKADLDAAVQKTQENVKKYGGALDGDVEKINKAKANYDAAVANTDNQSNPDNYEFSDWDGGYVYKEPAAAPNVQPKVATAPGEFKSAGAFNKANSALEPAPASSAPAAAPVSTQTAQPAVTAPKSGAAPASGNRGGGTAPASTPEATSEMTPEMKAFQAAFIKEHGGIGGGEAPATAEGESRFKAVASDPVDELLKKYDELTLAGKVGEAGEIEKQIAELGGQAKLSAHKSKVGAGNTKTFIPASDTAETAEATGSTAGIPPSPIKRAYEAIGPAGVLAIAQFGLGAAQSMKNKAPVPTVDPVLLQRRNEAMQKANMGLSPAEYGNAANRIESNRANVMRAISGVAGGDVGTIVGNARMASIDANRSRLDLESANNRMKQQNEARADNLVAAVAQQRQQVFAQNMNMFNQQQAASAGLMSAGLENLFGSISSRENQNRIDERADKYGTVNFTFPETT